MKSFTHTDVLRYTAFSTDPEGGNPAGVVLDAAGLDDASMLAVAAEVGYSETAFLTEELEPGRAFTVRYFSPQAEVAFCGHATVATAIALAEHRGRPGELVFETPAGTVPVEVTESADGTYRATLTSVEPHVADVAESDVAEALAALDWPPPTSTRLSRRASRTPATATWSWRPRPASGWRGCRTTSSDWPS